MNLIGEEVIMFKIKDDSDYSDSVSMPSLNVFCLSMFNMSVDLVLQSG